MIWQCAASAWFGAVRDWLGRDERLLDRKETVKLAVLVGWSSV